ncbi:MAG: glycogen phosphorylase [Proteobacteria bacterium]|nr:MAG: glycogen phosphorylase [Pseudomonadota bacterium]
MTTENDSAVQYRIEVEDDRTGMHPVTLERAVLDHLYYTCATNRSAATPLDIYHAVAHATRDRLVQRWMATQRTYAERDAKSVYYLSAEFLLGRVLQRNLSYLGADELARALLKKHRIDLDDIIAEEVDPGLGNGGLGRLAACFMDSLATLSYPAIGYGIRYEFGIFHQVIKDGWQIEQGDAWLRYGNPWELAKHELTVPVRFFGEVIERYDADGNYAPRWVGGQQVLGVPYDLPCPGYDNDTVNTLRLWSARASREFNLSVFNDGDYRRAVEEKALSESISKVLYPKDDSPQGKELRLKQQYFFVCCSLHDILRRYKEQHDCLDQLADKAAIQLNDTHPAIAVAELMRLLVDEERVPWEKAWDITVATVGYTNHTLLAEALERWPVAMFERLLPRHLQIIYEINQRLLEQVADQFPDDGARIARMSLIEEGAERQIRMAHLAVAGSHSVNGVAEMHSELVKTSLLPDFYALWPERFNNKTNGVTPRRWIQLCNPELSKAITDAIGDTWTHDLAELSALEGYAKDSAFLERIAAIKRANKVQLAKIVKATTGVEIDPDSLFDVQVKRIHQYKRQLMNCMHIISRYQTIKADPSIDLVPRTFIFGGKAAPGYAMAKLHIKLINSVADVVNKDPDVNGLMRIVFIPNYNVSLAERIIPAADISEQISMAGKEASGTGNMKFAMNGALTLGTLDGANVEIRDRVGADNFFLFGLDAVEVRSLKARGYHPPDFIARSERLKRAQDLVASGFFSPDDPGRFQPIVDALVHDDPYLVCADFDDYVRAHADVDAAYREPTTWQQKVVHNIANMGHFSSDRTIHEYARQVWGLEPCPVTLKEKNGNP